MPDDKKCKHILDNGQRCKGWAIKNKSYCFSHDPSSKEATLLAVTKGGLAKVIKVDTPLDIIPIATPSPKHKQHVVSLK